MLPPLLASSLPEPYTNLQCALNRPNLVPGVNPYTTSWGAGLPQYLNAAAFAPNTAGTYGNLGRDVLRGPGQIQFDASLSRIFAIHEAIRLEVRGEAFNVS